MNPARHIVMPLGDMRKKLNDADGQLEALLELLNKCNGEVVFAASVAALVAPAYQQLAQVTESLNSMRL